MPWQCHCSSQQVFICFSISGMFLVLSKLWSSQLRGSLVPLTPYSPTFKGVDVVLCCQERLFENLPALISSFILHKNFPQNPSQLSSDRAKTFALLKSKTFNLVLTFSVISWISKPTILWLLQPRLSLTKILQSRFSEFVSSKSSIASFLVGKSNICMRKQVFMHSRNLIDDVNCCTFLLTNV